MSKIKSFALLDELQKRELRKVFAEHPEAIKTLSSVDGEVGELAALALQCAGVIP